jgi:hypothetical protein
MPFVFVQRAAAPSDEAKANLVDRGLIRPSAISGLVWNFTWAET